MSRGQQQHRDAVGGGQRRAGEHVGRARADRRGARHGLQPVAHPGEADRGVHHALLVAGQVVGHLARCRPPPAGPGRRPATLPCPKIPNAPGIRRCSTPSRSLYWLARNRTSAWATVSLTARLLRGRERQAGVDLLVLPGAADPGVRRVVADQPGPLVAGPGHDVEVVEVVAGGGHRRAVPAVRDEHGVAAAHLGADVDLAARARGVDALVAGAVVGRPRSSRSPPARLALALLVVLVRRVGRPVRSRA